MHERGHKISEEKEQEYKGGVVIKAEEIVIDIQLRFKIDKARIAIFQQPTPSKNIQHH